MGVNVCVEDLGRTGFSGLLAETNEAATPAVHEGPGGVAPIAISHGPEDPAHAVALEQFQRWLADQREAAAS